MPTVASHVRTLKLSETTPDDDPYVLLVAAILARAYADAQGTVFAPGHQVPAQIQAEARQWLAEEQGVRDLVELCGVESAPVLRRVRQLVHAPSPEEQYAHA